MTGHSTALSASAEHGSGPCTRNPKSVTFSRHPVRTSCPTHHHPESNNIAEVFMGKHALQITLNPLRQFFLFFLHPFLSALSRLAFNPLLALSVSSVVKPLPRPTNPYPCLRIVPHSFRETTPPTLPNPQSEIRNPKFFIPQSAFQNPKFPICSSLVSRNDPSSIRNPKFEIRNSFVPPVVSEEPSPFFPAQHLCAAAYELER